MPEPQTNPEPHPNPPDVQHPPAEFDPQFDNGFDRGLDFGVFHPLYYVSHPWLLIYNPLALIGAGFWVWMLIHCLRNDPDRYIWLWVIFVLNVPGAILYFIVRWLPGNRVAHPSFITRWTRSRLIAQREAAARHIGNPHQFVELGDVLREAGRLDRASRAYQQALQKEPANMPALWGAALTEMQLKNHAAAKSLLQKILEKDAGYKFGDVSLAYGRTLVNTHEFEPAGAHLEQHLKRWTHPEAHVLLATILADKGEPQRARQHLENTLIDIDGGPLFFARQNRAWARKARKLLKRLPRTT